MFKHELIEALDIHAVEIDGKRFYINESGDRFPSVTTFLSASLDKSGLDEWRERVGEKEANRATNRGARRGEALHLVCEKYVLNEPLPAMMPSIQMLFSQVKPVLDARLECVIGVELPLMSNYLRLGGRCDLIGVFDGKRSIIDFKSTNWAKDRDMLEGYFIQETAYSIMFEECYNIPITQLVTISAGDSEHQAQVVVEKRDTWAPRLVSLVNKYHKERESRYAELQEVS
jgi:genome maintenance exonuclease 1